MQSTPAETGGSHSDGPKVMPQMLIFHLGGASSRTDHRACGPASARQRSPVILPEKRIRQRARHIALPEPHAARGRRLSQKLHGCPSRSATPVFWLFESSLIFLPLEISDAPDKVPAYRNQFPAFLSPIIQDLFCLVEFGRLYSNDKIFPHGRRPPCFTDHDRTRCSPRDYVIKNCEQPRLI
jgi:hypothetical protein